MVRSITASMRRKSRLRNGDSTLTRNDPIVHWATALQRPKPSLRWNKGQQCTNIQTGPLKWGRSGPVTIYLDFFVLRHSLYLLLLISIMPITVNAACSASGTIVSVMNNAINNGANMFRHTGNYSTPWQFTAAQMHLTSRADCHGRHPFPTFFG